MIKASYRPPKLILDAKGNTVGVGALKANGRVKFWHIERKKYETMSVKHFNLIYREVEA